MVSAGNLESTRQPTVRSGVYPEIMSETIQPIWVIPSGGFGTVACWDTCKQKEHDMTRSPGGRTNRHFAMVQPSVAGEIPLLWCGFYM